MPPAPRKICRHAGCTAIAVSGTSYCEKHADDEKQRKRMLDADRGSSTDRGYSKAWSRASKAFLKRHPLCAECERQGRVTPAEVTDHIIPWKGDRKLFWDSKNWQPLCKRCHDRKTFFEDGGFGRATLRRPDRSSGP